MDKLSQQILLGAASGKKKKQYVALGHENTPFISAYPWDNASGFGAKYANPSSLPAGSCTGVTFNPDGTSIVASHITSAPYVAAYEWSDLGFGARFSNPSPGFTNTGQCASFNLEGTAVAIGWSTSPFIRAYLWSSSGFGTAYANPSSTPSNIVNFISFSNDGNFVAFAIALGRLNVYEWSNISGFGARIANVLPANLDNGFCVDFAPNDGAIIMSGSRVGSTNHPIAAWPWSPSGLGAQYSNPSSRINSTPARAVQFSSDGNFVAVGHSSTPFLDIYEWNNSTGFGARISSPTTLPPGSCDSLTFSTDGKTLLAGSQTSPHILAYEWSSSGFGARYSDPSSLPSGTGRGIAFLEI